MALIVTGKDKTAFRSEEVVCISHLINGKTGKLNNKISIILKSGRDFIVICKTVKEAKEFKDRIIEILKQEY